MIGTRPEEGGENLLLVAHVAIGDPGSAEFFAQQSLVSFAGSQVAARLLVPTVDQLLVISLNAEGDSVGLLEISVRHALLWELGVLNDAQFTSFWRSLNPWAFPTVVLRLTNRVSLALSRLPTLSGLLGSVFARWGLTRARNRCIMANI